MSNIYIKEPATNGKVILKTTLGDIDCELWSREAPKACRNFVQLCMEGYYDGTIFHRVLKGFIAQGGDPTGTGFGGDSVYGEPFKDEFHSRLRFVRRGLLAMANSEKDSNGSQFFFTLGACPELQDKHTIFGKVTGNTLYNMIKFDELHVDQNDRPLYPPKILSAEIVLNPFDDIIPREKEMKKISKKEERPKVKGTKDFKLLSFGDEAEEEEEAVEEVIKGFKGKGKSSHDLLDDPKLSSIPAVDNPLLSAKGDNDDNSMDSESSKSSDKYKKKHSSKRRKKEDEKSFDGTKVISNSNPFGEGTSKDFLDEPVDDYDPEIDEKQLALEKLRAESKKLKKSLAKKKPTIEIKPEQPVEELNPIKSEIIRLKKEVQEAKSKSNSYEKFQQFVSKYKNCLANDGQSKNDANGESSEKNKSRFALFSHKMISEETEPVLAKDANLIKEADWFDIYDPRHPVNKRRREAGNESGSTTIKKSNHKH